MKSFWCVPQLTHRVRGAALSVMSQLQSLHIQRMINVSGAAFAAFHATASLRALHLERCVNLEPVAMERLLGRFTELESLHVVHSNVML